MPSGVVQIPHTAFCIISHPFLFHPPISLNTGKTNAFGLSGPLFCWSVGSVSCLGNNESRMWLSLLIYKHLIYPLGQRNLSEFLVLSSSIFTSFSLSSLPLTLILLDSLILVLSLFHSCSLSLSPHLVDCLFFLTKLNPPAIRPGLAVMSNQTHRWERGWQSAALRRSQGDRSGTREDSTQ